MHKCRQFSRQLLTHAPTHVRKHTTQRASATHACTNARKHVLHARGQMQAACAPAIAPMRISHRRMALDSTGRQKTPTGTCTRFVSDERPKKMKHAKITVTIKQTCIEATEPDSNDCRQRHLCNAVR